MTAPWRMSLPVMSVWMSVLCLHQPPLPSPPLSPTPLPPGWIELVFSCFLGGGGGVWYDPVFIICPSVCVSVFCQNDLPNCSSFCNPTWYGGASAQGMRKDWFKVSLSVRAHNEMFVPYYKPCEKIDLRSHSQWGLIMKCLYLITSHAKRLI